MGSYTQLHFLSDQLKQCTWCGEAKPLSEFHRDMYSRDGHRAHCKECGCADTRKWNAANRDKISRRCHQFYVANRKLILARRRLAYREGKYRYEERWHAYAETHREEAKKRAREYQRTHPERVRFHRYARRARISGKPDAETVAFSKMLRKDTCSYCGGPAGSLDHIVPVFHGGKHHWTNLTAACRRCNSSKSTSSLLAFLHRTNRRSGC